MKIIVNDKNEILSFATIGGIEGSIEYGGTLPDDFEINFKPSFYLLKDNEIIENSDYEEPAEQEIEPSALEKQVANTSYQTMLDNQQIDDLKKQNAQMAYQIMTGGNK